MSAVMPLLALRAFAEAGRLGSLKAAAERMGVTPGAVSQQIRLLEDRLGMPLFVRERYGVNLTEVSAQVHPALLQAFDLIEKSLAWLESSAARRTLTISTVPSFAAHWLVPRLGGYAALHPDIEVRVEASSKLVDFQRDRIDIALRHGLGDYPGLAVMPLMTPVLLPVATPALLRDGPPLRVAADCLRYPLLQDADRADWSLWLQAHGVPPGDAARRGSSFEDDLLLLRAAAAGQGIALVPQAHAREDLDSGRLRVALDLPWPTRFAYYAVSLPDAARRPEVRGFLDWLADEIARSDGNR
ncbi:LysR substrate-binding domain-containing protein [Achromobacter pestifer]|uniref:Glycine cleavage system transcriptional activator n=1 Tax=Achromobacter pestifer TaxID=1353889 RepID=A0A6S6ZZK5_9BURK|nr:LysR substrate-binding domain-containing protein [Achromobacter pestifer]CAB3702819.1 Glycine cleavage system transcriptional activator [Achromobacter pestifer]